MKLKIAFLIIIVSVSSVICSGTDVNKKEISSQQQDSISGRTKINIQLQPEVTWLDKEVVIGYGTAKRSDLVSAVSTVAERDIKALPVARADQVLQGVTTGVRIQNISSAPNHEVVIRIRGINSLQLTNDPLIVVDGFIGSVRVGEKNF